MYILWDVREPTSSCFDAREMAWITIKDILLDRSTLPQRALWESLATPAVTRVRRRSRSGSFDMSKHIY